MSANQCEFEQTRTPVKCMRVYYSGCWRDNVRLRKLSIRMVVRARDEGSCVGTEETGISKTLESHHVVVRRHKG